MVYRRFLREANKTYNTVTSRATAFTETSLYLTSLKVPPYNTVTLPTDAGVIYVKTASPTQLWFIDSAGTEWQLGSGTGAPDLNLLPDGTVNVEVDEFIFLDFNDGNAAKLDRIQDLLGQMAGAAGSGLASDVTTGQLTVDFFDLDTATIAVNSDSIGFFDATTTFTFKDSVVDWVADMAGAGLTASNGQLVLGTLGILQVPNGGTGVNTLLGDSILVGDGTADIVAEAFLKFTPLTRTLSLGRVNVTAGGGIIRASATAGCDWADGYCGDPSFVVFTPNDFTNTQIRTTGVPRTLQNWGVFDGLTPVGTRTFPLVPTGGIMDSAAFTDTNRLVAVKLLPVGFRITNGEEVSWYASATLAVTGGYP